MGYTQTIANSLQVGDKVKLTREVETISGKFSEGTIVTITHKSQKGYDFEDAEGNIACEVGFDIGVKEPDNKELEPDNKELESDNKETDDDYLIAALELYGYAYYSEREYCEVLWLTRSDFESILEKMGRTKEELEEMEDAVYLGELDGKHSEVYGNITIYLLEESNVKASYSEYEKNADKLYRFIFSECNLELTCKEEEQLKETWNNNVENIIKNINWTVYKEIGVSNNNQFLFEHFKEIANGYNKQIDEIYNRAKKLDLTVNFADLHATLFKDDEMIKCTEHKTFDYILAFLDGYES